MRPVRNWFWHRGGDSAARRRYVAIVESRVSARGPSLWLGDSVEIDCRQLDRVELTEQFPDHRELRLVLAVGEVEATLPLGLDHAAAERLIVELAPYTRAAPLRGEQSYHDAVDLRDALLADDDVLPPALRLFGDPAITEQSHVYIGVTGFLTDDVETAAKAGDDLELIGGQRLPAALVLLAIEAARPEPAVATLSDRIRDYEETARPRSMPS